MGRGSVSFQKKWRKIMRILIARARRNSPGTEGFLGKKQVLQDSLRENIRSVILKYIKIGYL